MIVRPSHPCPALALAVAAAAAPAQTVRTLNPAATFLHTTSDPAADAIPIALAEIGVGPGDLVRLKALGDFDCGSPCVDDRRTTIAVFSSSDVLLSAALLHRVPDAIDAGEDAVTGATYFGNQPTDIPEDFAITLTDGTVNQVVIAVPPGAAFVFVCAADSLYSDNSDPDGDYAVELSAACPGDFNSDGAVDFFDVQAFLNAFAAKSPAGDVNGDGGFDFFDVQAFLNAFAAGCA